MIARRSKVSRREAGIPSTAVTNELADAVNFDNPSFLTGVESRDMTWTFSFDAIIWDAGPSGEANRTNESYWVKPQCVTSGLATDVAGLRNDIALTSDPIVLATNFAERRPNAGAGGQTHLLPKGTFIRVFLDVDDGDPPKARYVFNRVPYRLLPVALTVDGGTDGSATTTASYTYLAEDADKTGYQYANHLSYAQRPKGKTLSATHGLIREKPDGSFALVWCDEVPNYTKYGVATDVTCNGDGTITVTKTDILSPT